MNILLINPWIHDFSAYDLWYKPLGLLSLASLLRRNGAQITFIDCLHPDETAMGPEPHRAMPKRKPSGEGFYAAEGIPKPPPLKSIPRNYHRFGILRPDHLGLGLLALGNIAECADKEGLTA